MDILNDPFNIFQILLFKEKKKSILPRHVLRIIYFYYNKIVMEYIDSFIIYKYNNYMENLTKQLLCAIIDERIFTPREWIQLYTIFFNYSCNLPIIEKNNFYNFSCDLIAQLLLNDKHLLTNNNMSIYKKKFKYYLNIVKKMNMLMFHAKLNEKVIQSFSQGKKITLQHHLDKDNFTDFFLLLWYNKIIKNNIK